MNWLDAGLQPSMDILGIQATCDATDIRVDITGELSATLCGADSAQLWDLGHLARKTARVSEGTHLAVSIIEWFEKYPELKGIELEFECESQFNDEGGTYMSVTARLKPTVEGFMSEELETQICDEAIENEREDIYSAFVDYPEEGASVAVSVTRGQVYQFISTQPAKSISAKAAFNAFFPEYANS